MRWILFGYYGMFMCGGQNLWFYKASLRICYVSLFECKGPGMLKIDSLKLVSTIFYQILFFHKMRAL